MIISFKGLLFLLQIGGVTMPKIMRIEPKDDHTLLIELNNRHMIVYDMKPRLMTVRFCGLADIDRFKAVRIEDENTLVWDSLCQITIDEVLNAVGK